MLDVLATLLVEGHFPIVYVDLWPLQGGLSGQYHALAVIDLDTDQGTVLDPPYGECRVPREAFLDPSTSRAHRLGAPRRGWPLVCVSPVCRLGHSASRMLQP